jgi:hypothetical protein
MTNLSNGRTTRSLSSASGKKCRRRRADEGCFVPCLRGRLEFARPRGPTAIFVPRLFEDAHSVRNQIVPNRTPNWLSEATIACSCTKHRLPRRTTMSESGALTATWGAKGANTWRGYKPGAGSCGRSVSPPRAGTRASCRRRQVARSTAHTPMGRDGPWLGPSSISTPQKIVGIDSCCSSLISLALRQRRQRAAYALALFLLPAAHRSTICVEQLLPTGR